MGRVSTWRITELVATLIFATMKKRMSNTYDLPSKPAGQSHARWAWAFRRFGGVMDCINLWIHLLLLLADSQ